MKGTQPKLGDETRLGVFPTRVERPSRDSNLREETDFHTDLIPPVEDVNDTFWRMWTQTETGMGPVGFEQIAGAVFRGCVVGRHSHRMPVRPSLYCGRRAVATSPECRGRLCATPA